MTTQDASPSDGGRPVRDWFSGWCGTGPCRDGFPVDDGDRPAKRYCRYEALNGERVERRRLLCACDCHQDGTPGAVQAADYVLTVLKPRLDPDDVDAAHTSWATEDTSDDLDDAA